MNHPVRLFASTAFATVAVVGAARLPAGDLAAPPPAAAVTVAPELVAHHHPTSASASTWRAVADCETGARSRRYPNGAPGSAVWTEHHRARFSSGLQFTPSTWRAYKLAGYPAVAWHATPVQQMAVANRVLAAQGWGAWPDCARRLGLR